MPVLTFDQLADVCAEIMEAAGAPKQQAHVVGIHLAQSNLYGVDSHGVQNLPVYIRLIREGRINPRSEWSVVRESPSTALIDASWGIGQVSAEAAMKLAIEKGAATGIGAVGLRNSNHVGRLGHYTELAAQAGMIGVAYVNTDPTVAPWGGTKPRLGTNPVSYAMPVPGGHPILVDFASSVVAEGKVRAALARGERIPEGWIVDKDGRPSTDPADLYAPSSPSNPLSIVGALLPAGGYKGYGLAIVSDVLGGALTGWRCSVDVESGNGALFQAIDIESFSSRSEYDNRVRKLIADIKSSPTAPGFKEVLVPGEPEFRTAEQRKPGIPIPETTWSQIRTVGESLNVRDLPAA